MSKNIVLVEFACNFLSVTEKKLYVLTRSGELEYLLSDRCEAQELKKWQSLKNVTYISLKNNETVLVVFSVPHNRKAIGNMFFIQRVGLNNCDIKAFSLSDFDIYDSEENIIAAYFVV